MRNYWIRFGCFLTGYNFSILKDCSEASIRKLLRYTSAMVIICLLWAFIGYAFTERYLKGEWYWCLAGMILMIVIVVQIERQVILSSSRKNLIPYLMRSGIAVAMALIGSLIIDQIIFSDDIEREKIFAIGAKVDEAIPSRTAELNHQISQVDSAIIIKEHERYTLLDELSKSPMISSVEKVVHPTLDSAGKAEVTLTFRKVQNPKMQLIPALDAQIANLQENKSSKETSLLALRQVVENDLNSKQGFLDELNLMIDILVKSPVAMCVWGIWFIFLCGLEMFILVSKWKDTTTDYDEMINFQMTLHLKRIELLTRA